MASKFDHYSTAKRGLVYQPVVAQDKTDGYSAEDVNRLMMEIEQQFDTYVRKIERQLSDARESLSARRAELAKLANLADKRSDASNTAMAALSQEVAARDNEIVKIKTELEQQGTAAKIDRETAASLQAQMSLQITDLEAKVNEMRQSKSWRLTRPLRFIFNRPKRG